MPVFIYKIAPLKPYWRGEGLSGRRGANEQKAESKATVVFTEVGTVRFLLAGNDSVEVNITNKQLESQGLIRKYKVDLPVSKEPKGNDRLEGPI